MAKQKGCLDWKKFMKQKNCPLYKIKYNDLMSEKHKKCVGLWINLKTLNTFVSAIIGCVLISAFPSLVGVFNGIVSSGKGIKICEITAVIKIYKSVIKKKE